MKNASSGSTFLPWGNLVMSRQAFSCLPFHVTMFFSSSSSSSKSIYLRPEIVIIHITNLGLLSTRTWNILNIAREVSLMFIARNFECKTTRITLFLYISMIGPYLEYAALFWSPILKNDTELLESTRNNCLKIQSIQSRKVIHISAGVFQTETSTRETIFLQQVLQFASQVM